jgi:hypothetical protein
MLGSLSEADDAVQEAWLRFSRSDTSAIENLRVRMTTIVAPGLPRYWPAANIEADAECCRCRFYFRIADCAPTVITVMCPLRSGQVVGAVIDASLRMSATRSHAGCTVFRKVRSW